MVTRPGPSDDLHWLDDLARSTTDPGRWGALLADRIRATDPTRGRRLGTVATPPSMASALLAASWPASPPGRLLDPACGGGALLVPAAQRLWAELGAEAPSDRVDVLHERVLGQDVDPFAVQTARRALAHAAGAPEADLSGVVQHADAFDASACADLILANPPWVDASTLPAERRAWLAERYPEARGAWDLSVPFVARLLDRLEPGGVLALLLPRALAGAPYAAALRARLVLSGRLRTLLDLSHHDLGVGAWALGLVLGARSDAPTRWHQGASVQEVHLPADGGPWIIAPPPASPWPTLDEIAQVHGAATVAEAYAWRDLLVSGTPDEAHHPVVNTGTIDPFTTHWDRRPMRYLGRRLERPILPLATLSVRRREQALGPKLIVAGLSRTLEVLPDLEGRWIAGKSTVVVRHHDPDMLAWLAAWLSSPAASAAYRHRHASLALRGDYLRVSPRPLGSLPVPPAPEASVRPHVLACLAAPDDADLLHTLHERVDRQIGRCGTQDG